MKASFNDVKCDSVSTYSINIYFGFKTTIWDPKNPEDKKKFAFDHSYWSFDGSKDDKTGYTASDPSHKNGKKFCDQVCIVDRQIASIYKI